MGAKLAIRAVDFRTDRKLANAARVLLITMALHARDDDEEPRSYLGRAKLAHALGYSSLTPAAASAVSRWIGVLVRARAITPINRPHEGRRAEYRLNLSAVSGYRSAGTTQGEEVTAESARGHRSATERSPLTGTQGRNG